LGEAELSTWHIHKKSRKSLFLRPFLKLPGQDSNLDKESQNLTLRILAIRGKHEILAESTAIIELGVDSVLGILRHVSAAFGRSWLAFVTLL